MCSSKEVRVRAFCGVMMRQYLDPSNPSWSKVSPENREKVKGALLAVMKSETERPARLSFAACVGSLAVKILSPTSKTKGTWPQLLPLLIELSKSDSGPLRESSLQV